MCWVKLGWTFAFRLLSKEVKDFKEAMRFAISRAGDTDTNACIVGGLIGASIGFRELYRQCKY
jgi:ADP-ribosylglycohydrolase